MTNTRVAHRNSRSLWPPFCGRIVKEQAMAFATAYHTRLGVPLTDLSKEDRLGLLADLPGTWVGSGFTLISLPDFDSKPPSDGPKPFRLKLNATIETLQFTPIGGDVPNRGSLTDFGSTTGQPD